MSATAVTWTDLANLALIRINQDRLDSIDDETVMAGRIRDIRRQVATEVLETHDWESASKRVRLSELSGGILGLWEKSYTLPTDFIRCSFVWNHGLATDGSVSSDGPRRHDWKVEGNVLYVGELRDNRSSNSSSSEKMSMAYVAYTESDLGIWSPHLRRAIAAKLAADLAVGTTGGLKYSQALEADYERVLRRAQTLDTARLGNQMQRYDNKDHGMRTYSYSNA